MNRAEEFEAQCSAGGMAANLVDRDLATEQVHRVLQRAAAGELERVERAVGLEQPGDLEALVEPQPARHAVGHVELRDDRHLGRRRLRDRAHDLAGEAGSVLQLPPNLSPRLLRLGLRERAEQVVVTEVDLDAVEARPRRHSGQRARNRTRARSSTVAAGTRLRPGALNRRDGASERILLETASASGPCMA